MKTGVLMACKIKSRFGKISYQFTQNDMILVILLVATFLYYTIWFTFDSTTVIIRIHTKAI